MNTKPTILYVDDENINLQLFTFNFKKKYTVLTALSGYQGLEILNNNNEISVVISDMKMPGINGIEFIKQAKQNFPNIIFFILTGFDITDEISQALTNNLINRYFSKPFIMKEIDDAIQDAIGHKIT